MGLYFNTSAIVKETQLVVGYDVSALQIQDFLQCYPSPNIKTIMYVVSWHASIF